MIVDDGAAELARIDVRVNGFGKARAVAMAVADELGTATRPRRVRFAWHLGDSTMSQVLYITCCA